MKVQLVVRIACLWSLALAACGPASKPAPAAPSTPAGIALDGDPNGLFWEEKRARLIIADDAHNRLLSWQEGHAVAVLAELPAESGKGGLGQPVVDEAGNVLVPRFGHGTGGAVLRIDAAGRAVPLAGLDPARRRIGLAASQGRLFETYFVRAADHREGGAAEIESNGTEAAIGVFRKPIGVVVMNDALFVADQDEGAVFQCATRAPGNCKRLAALTEPDLLAIGPDGSLFTGGRGGQLRQIRRDGTVSVVAAGTGEIRGVAWDAAGKRVFLARRSAGHGAIEIVPLPAK